MSYLLSKKGLFSFCLWTLIVSPLAAGIVDDGYESAEDELPTLPLKTKSPARAEAPLTEEFFQNLKSTLDDGWLHELGSRFARFFSKPKNQKYAYLGRRIIENGKFSNYVRLCINGIKDTRKALAVTAYYKNLIRQDPNRLHSSYIDKLGSMSFEQIERLGKCTPRLFTISYLKEDGTKHPSQIFLTTGGENRWIEDKVFHLVRIFEILKDIPEEKLKLIADAVPLLPVPYWEDPWLTYPFDYAHHKHIITALMPLTVEELQALHRSVPFSLEQMLKLWRHEISMKDLIKPKTSE